MQELTHCLLGHSLVKKWIFPFKNFKTIAKAHSLNIENQTVS